jgi:hypothetical protein
MTWQQASIRRPLLGSGSGTEREEWRFLPVRFEMFQNCIRCLNNLLNILVQIANKMGL